MEDLQLQTRTEHSRSVDDAEQFKAIETLKEIGLLIPVSDLNVYHGRVTDGGEGEWTVDPAFSNAGNNTGNGNVYSRSNLYTAERDNAEAVAVERLRSYNGLLDDPDERAKVELHNIISSDADATIIDQGFDESTLDDTTRQKYHEALGKLRPAMSEGSPVSFDNRDAIRPVLDRIISGQAHGKPYVTSKEIAAIAKDSGVEEDLVLQLAGSVNAGWLLPIKPAVLVDKMLKNAAGIVPEVITDGGVPKELPINLEYVERFLRKNHIIGTRFNVTSATINRSVSTVAFFDLDKTYTDTQLEKKRHETWKQLGGIATTLRKAEKRELPEHKLLQVLTDVHAKPEHIVAAAMEVPGFKQIFQSDTGNWERFSLAEHTETVLRNFDENYADKLPVSLLAPMRLAIVAHDTGKPHANYEGTGQKAYNLKYAGQFFTELDIDPASKQLYLAMIGDGEELAANINRNIGAEQAEADLRNLAITTLKAFNGEQPVTDDQIEGFVEMCKILQICDGGAYTSMAVTRHGNGKGMYRNNPTFNGSFAPPVDLSSRGIRLRSDNSSAPHDLTPRAAKRVSRLRISRADNPGAKPVKINQNGVG